MCLHKQKHVEIHPRPQEIQLIYLGNNKEIYLHFYDMLHFLQNAVYFIILSSSVQIILTFSLKQVQQFKYPPL